MQITIPLVKHGLGLFWLKAKNIPKIIWRDEITKGQKHLNWVLGNRFVEWGKNKTEQIAFPLIWLCLINYYR